MPVLNIVLLYFWYQWPASYWTYKSTEFKISCYANCSHYSHPTLTCVVHEPELTWKTLSPVLECGTYCQLCCIVCFLFCHIQFSYSPTYFNATAGQAFVPSNHTLTLTQYAYTLTTCKTIKLQKLFIPRDPVSQRHRDCKYTYDVQIHTTVTAVIIQLYFLKINPTNSAYAKMFTMCQLHMVPKLFCAA